MRRVKILGTGKYLPKRIVRSIEIDQLLGLTEGWTEKKSGIKTRHYVEDETASEMGASAALQALKNAKMDLNEIDAIVSVSGTMEQPIPCTAALIHQQLKPQRAIPAFDLNSTCLSFVTGLDVISHLIQAGTYKKVLFVSSEIASVGINPMQKESYILFGDGAAACIVGQASVGEASKIVASHMETYSEGAQLTEIRGGGTNLPAHRLTVEADSLFDMNGKGVFRLCSKHINEFVDTLLDQAGISMSEVQVVIPHQASGMALRIMRKKLGIHEENYVNVIEHYGNMIAASIPLALHDAIESGQITRGKKVMLLGTSAGVSIGGMILDY